MFGWTIDEAEDISKDWFEMILIISNRRNVLQNNLNKKHG